MQKLLLALCLSLLGLFAPGCTPPSSEHGHKDESARLETAFQQRRSKVWATIQARVKKNLPDDLKGSRHQRFLINLKHGQSVLVAHNIDLAPRAPIQAGHSIWLRGRYEWNAKGGVLHWTHHDPSHKKPGGWIEVSGQKYK